MVDYFKVHQTLGIVFFVAAMWSLVWKALALWKAARQGDKTWFIVLFIINSIGILDMFYIFGFSRRSDQSASVTVKANQE